jgi:maltose alpha-D-glucosyltransferase/alpha-amylase
MQWSTEKQGGFTTSSKPVLPVVTGGAYGFEHVNVAAQRRDPDSLLNWMERVFRMRKEVPEIGWGDFDVIPNEENAVLVVRYVWRGNAVLFIHNFDANPLEIKLDAKALGPHGGQLVNLLSNAHSRANSKGKHCMVIESYGYRWFRVGALDYLLKRDEM